jgi:hypothetical protein
MRQISTEEMKDVSGALCSNLTMSIGLTGVSVSGSLGDWRGCLDTLGNFARDKLNAYDAHYSTGIRYGEAHIG